MGWTALSVSLMTHDGFTLLRARPRAPRGRRGPPTRVSVATFGAFDFERFSQGTMEQNVPRSLPSRNTTQRTASYTGHSGSCDVASCHAIHVRSSVGWATRTPVSTRLQPCDRRSSIVSQESRRSATHLHATSYVASKYHCRRERNIEKLLEHGLATVVSSQ